MTEEVIRPEKKITSVTLPHSLLEALHALAAEPTGHEWGGGIDFEIIADKPQIERVMAYFAEEGKVPHRVSGKYERDVEVFFHTHPNQALVQPSPTDIQTFVMRPAQVSFIIAREEIALLEKRDDFEERIQTVKGMSVPTYYEPEKAVPMIKNELDKIGIDYVSYPRGMDSPVFDLEIVRRLAEKQ